MNKATEGSNTLIKTEHGGVMAHCSDMFDDYECHPPRQSVQIHKHCTDMFDEYECRMHMNLMEEAQGAEPAFDEDALSFLGETAAQPETFDFTAAAAGFSIGFVAAYAILRSLKRKKDEDFMRV